MSSLSAEVFRSFMARLQSEGGGAGGDSLGRRILANCRKLCDYAWHVCSVADAAERAAAASGGGGGGESGSSAGASTATSAAAAAVEAAAERAEADIATAFRRLVEHTAAQQAPLLTRLQPPQHRRRWPS